MTPPPTIGPGCPRGDPPGSSADRRLVAIGFVLFCTPMLLGAAGSIVFAREAIGPLITLVVWIAFLVVRVVRWRGTSFIEVFAVIGALVMLQLLLDLHTPHLGDIVIVALHAPFLLIGLVAFLRARWRRKPDA